MRTKQGRTKVEDFQVQGKGSWVLTYWQYASPLTRQYSPAIKKRPEQSIAVGGTGSQRLRAASFLTSANLFCTPHLLGPFSPPSCHKLSFALPLENKIGSSSPVDGRKMHPLRRAISTSNFSLQTRSDGLFSLPFLQPVVLFHVQPFGARLIICVACCRGTL